MTFPRNEERVGAVSAPLDKVLHYSTTVLNRTLFKSCPNILLMNHIAGIYYYYSFSFVFFLGHLYPHADKNHPEDLIKVRREVTISTPL